MADLAELHPLASIEDEEMDDTISMTVQLDVQDHLETDRAISTVATETVEDGGPSVAPEPRRALVIEDDPDCREILTRQLEALGYEVRAAPSVVRALAIGGTLRWVPDLLVTDLHMPRIDGLAAVRLVRSVACFPSLPVVVVSGVYTRGRDEGVLAELEAEGAVFVRKGQSLRDVLPEAIAEAGRLALASPAGAGRVRGG